MQAVIIGQGGKGSSGSGGLSTVTSNQGLAGLITAPWPVELSNGTVEIGTSTTPLRVDPTGTTVQPVSFSPETSGGLSSAVAQALTTSVQVKGSAGQFYGFDWFNPNSYTVYVFVYNTTTTTPTIGGTTNLIYQKGLPAGAGSNWQTDFGIPCSNGICISVSTVANSTGAPSTGLVLTTLYD
jgi:hypothetical protein